MKKVAFTNNRYLLLFILPLLYLPCYISNDMVIQLTKEDGFYESTGAILFLLTAIAFSWLAANRNHFQGENGTGRYVERLYFLFFAILFVFAFGEEISWGQRIFNYSTPEAIDDVNQQGEFNLHNIGIFHGKTSEGVEKTGFSKLLTMTRLFYMAFLIYLLIIPIIHKKNSRINAFINKIKLPVPPIIFGVFFGFNIIFAKLLGMILNDIDADGIVAHGIVEIKETVFALLLFMLPLSWINIKTLKNPSSLKS